MEYLVKHHYLQIDGKKVDYVESYNRGGLQNPKLIVLHDTASGLDPRGPISWLSRKGGNSSAHFVVGIDGHITQLMPLKLQAWHAGKSVYKGEANVNRFSIGIEMVNPGKMTLASGTKDAVTGAKMWTGAILGNSPTQRLHYASTPQHGPGVWLEYAPAQIEAVERMCTALIAAYPIEDITTHWHISPGRKVDPNPLFPLEEVRAVAFGRKNHSGSPRVQTIVETNLRRWPHPDSAIVQKVRKGKEVEIIRSGYFDGPMGNQQWHLVRNVPTERGEGTVVEGWLNAFYVEEV